MVFYMDLLRFHNIFSFGNPGWNIYIYTYIYIVQYGFHTIDMGRFMVSFRFLIGLLDCDWFQCFFATTPANIGP
jgi:hypothetical protein